MGGLRRDDALPLVAALPALALFAWWIADNGGYFPVAWMPGALALVWLLVVLAVVPGALRRPPRALTVALAALAAYTAWSFASMAWAQAPGVALEGATRTLLYLAVFTVFALLPWTPRAAVVALVVFVAVVTIAGVVTIVRAAGTPAASVVSDGRLVAPLGYQNASAALWTMAALPALALAATRAMPALARPPLLAAAGFLLGLAVLAQSRGWLFTLPVVALVALAALRGDDRARFVAFAFPVALAVGLATPDLLEPHDLGGGRPVAEVAAAVGDAIGRAAGTLALAAGGLLLAGAALVWADRRYGARLGRAGTALVVAVLCGGLAAGLVATHGDPLGRADSAWADFKDYDRQSSEQGTSRFGDLSSVRYDFWRVGLNAWRDHPLGGLGQDNFAAAYVRERASPTTEARWLHSLELRALVHTGVVGVALLVSFVAAVALCVLRRPVSRSGALALMPAIVWLTHGSVDWLWEYPALSGAALALAASACALAAPTAAAPIPRAARAGLIALAVAGSLVVIPPYIAERDVRTAAEQWRAYPAAALSRLDRAQDLNPLDAQAALVEGLIAAELGRTAQARAAFAEAADRDPGLWLPHFQLGLLAGEDGDRTGARRHLLAARSRNPHGQAIAEALRRRRPMSRAEGAEAVRNESERQQGIIRAQP